MSKFSDLLEHHIVKSRLTDGYLANLSGFSRSYVTKIKRGDRFSRDTEKMTRMFEAIPMTLTEKNELWNLYLEQLLGKEGYDLNHAILDYISSFKSVASLPVNVSLQYQYEISDLQILENQEDIKYITRILIEQEASRPEGHLRILVQPEFKSALEAVKSGLRMNKNFRVEHLVGLEQSSSSKEEQNDNIKIIGKLNPIILSQQGNGYQVYYYYEKIGSHFDQFSIMPYFLITGEMVMNISVDYKKAVLWKNPEIRELYTDIFDTLTRESHILYKMCEDSENTAADYWKQNLILRNEEIVYCMGSQPCIGVAGNEALFHKYALDMKQDMVASILHVNQANRAHLDHIKIVSYFTKQGIEYLLKQGRLEEVPSELYRPLDYEDGCMLIRTILNMTAKGIYEPHLIDDRKFLYPSGLIINSHEESKIVIYYNSENINKRFIVGESILANRFYEFLDQFKNSTYVHTVKDTVAYLESVVGR